MNTGQTMLTIGALVLLMTALVGFYRLLSHNGERLEVSQSGITSTTIATSLMEVAAGLAFDAVTDTTSAAIGNVNVLTNPNALGNEGTFDDSLVKYDDFDDFDGDTLVRFMPGELGVFTAAFEVNYIDPNNINQISANRTYLKRLDMKIWRSWPLAQPGETIDTTHMSMVQGYFHFD